MDNLPFDANAIQILEKRYLQRDKDGNIVETPRELFERVADTVSSVEKERDRETWREVFFNMMWSKQFLPNSPTLVNAGTNKGSLSACFVMSPEDTMESIMQVAYDSALVEKWGGGIGFNLSHLRPKNDSISTTHGKALGPIGVMRIYAKLGTEITQGSFRLGAHMAMLSVDHPDIREFIHCKDDVRNNNELSNFNISVRIPDSFMLAVESGDDWPLFNPRNGEIVETVSASELWNEICQSAWETGDPGLGFMDRVMETHPNPQLDELTSNPCGEQMLENYNSCNLGSINLYQHLNKTKTGIDYDTLGSTVHVAVRFLDNVVSVNTFPIEKIANMNARTRRIGLGVMGWADVLMALDIPYNSQAALNLAEEIASFIKESAWTASIIIAQQKGPFPEFEYSALKEMGMLPVRNSCITNTAPTGTISRIAGCSSGIEPYFALVYTSNVLWEDQDGTTTTLYDVPQAVRDYLEECLTAENVERFLRACTEGDRTVMGYYMHEYSMDYKLLNSTALTISPEDHINMQAVWQKHGNTNATSKTINLKESESVSAVKNAYNLAWETGCKGITVYRQGSRDIEVLNTGKTEEKSIIPKEQWIRPDSLQSVTTKKNTGHGALYITEGYQEQVIREVFLSMGKAGGCESANMEAVARLVSIALQYNVPKAVIVKQLEGITCCPAWDKGVLVKSPMDALANLLKEEIDGNALALETTGFSCPECNSELISESGCFNCPKCGYSKCG